MQLFDIAAVAGAAAASTVAAAIWMLKNQRKDTPQALQADADSTQNVSFLFEDENLHHASDMASSLYQLVPGLDDWSVIHEKLMNRFPGLPETPVAIETGETTIPARDVEDLAVLTITRKGAFTRINWHEDGVNTPAQSERFKVMQQEMDHLRRASDTTSHAIWQVDGSGTVIWYNSHYKTLYNRLHETDPDEKKPVFDLAKDFSEETGHKRVSIVLPNENHKDWYDISAVSVGEFTVFHAIDMNAVVKSEIAQRNFVQTLAKTFAQLSIGLAIFDRNGQLALFNPALIDLTELPADFLSGRPTLMSFFDRIRENRRMPEPKNYKSWREQIKEVISAATDGHYQETWTLETGQTYRVNGRPHPDGAIAFLIEDISAEMSVTRNFRAELELGQSLMDSFDEALVVFSSTGVLTFCNLAYREMFAMDPDNSFAEVTINDCVLEWKKICKTATCWADLTDFVLDYGEKSSWELQTSLLTGGALHCAVSRISSGATIVRFAKQQSLTRIEMQSHSDTALQ